MTNAGRPSANRPSWSVSTECGFYLLFVPLAHDFARTWRWKLALAGAVPAGVAAAAAAAGWPWAPPPGQPSYEHFLYFHPLARVWQFALGMATALAWRRAAAWRPGPALGTLAEVAALALAGAAVWAEMPLGGWCLGVPWLGMPVNHLVVGGSLLATGPFALLILVMAGGWGLVSRLLAAGPAVLLGDLSYGVYILHWPLLQFVVLHREAVAGVPGWQVGAAFAAGLLVLAHWAYHLVERPARRLLVGLWPADAPAPGGRGGRGRAAGLAAETLAVAGLAVGAGWYVRKEGVQFVGAGQAEELVRHARPAPRGVEFGGAYRLRGAAVEPAAGGLRLRLVWQSLRRQPPWFHVLVQFNSPAPAEECLAAVDFARALRADWVLEGEQWEQRLFLPAGKMAAGPNVALIVLTRDETTFLPMAGGPLDAHGRLRLDLTPPPGGGPPPGRRGADDP